jgi:ribonuclease HI
MEGTFDGGSRGNPGVAGAGFVLWSAEGPRRRRVDAGTVYVGDSETNNVAEYSGAIALVEAALKHGATSLHVKGDSKLVIMQVTGRWKVKAPHLVPYRDRLRAAADRFPEGCRFTHVRRHLNKAADGMSNLAMDDRKSFTGLHLLDRLPEADRAPPPADTPEDAPRPAKVPRTEGVVRTTTRVRIRRRRDGTVVQDCDRYVGRKVTKGGWDLPQDDFCSPITPRVAGGAAEAVRRYFGYLCKRKDLLQRLLDGELRGLRLGCFCEEGEPCHADVLAELSDDVERVKALLAQI